MKYGVFSDIHGNLQALEAVLDALKKEKVDFYLCGGDVVGYGANPQECIDRILRFDIPCIAGNHDWAVIDKTDIAYFNPVAKAAIFWTKSKMQPQGVKFLNELEIIFKHQELMMVHGLLPFPERFDYLTEVHQAQEMFAYMDGKICFVGHTHVPQIFIQEDEKITESYSAEIEISNGKKYIINVGSVGQPRDGVPLAAYCVYDSKLQTAAIKRIPYEIQEAQERILQAGLPVFLAQRLALGR